MKLKNKIALLSTLFVLQTFGVNAAEIDRELAVLAAEQDKNTERVETFDPDSIETNRTKTKDEIKAEEKRLEEERKAAKKKIKDERKKSRDELKGNKPVSKNPAPSSRTSAVNVQASSEKVEPVVESPAVKDSAVNITPPVAEIKPAQEIPPAISTNPIINYANFNDIVQAVNFTPLYIPKKSGYDIVSMMTINNKIAEISYRRKWETNVLLNVRTYHRPEGEALKDISGIQGVKWRVNPTNGITTYIAKINENHHVAAWAVGRYTFSAYVENLSFAAFHSLVAEELVDLSQHYYLN